MLRRAPGETPEDHRYIVTLPVRGYRFADEVRTVNPMPTDVVVEGHSRSRVVIEQNQSSRLGLIVFGCLIALAIAGVVGVQAYWDRRRPARISASTIPTRRSIAVLGFQNVSGDPRDTWLSIAFSEMLAPSLN